jgi:hypothetical protein
MTIWGKEPALIVGTVVTIILAAVQTLAGNGLISDVSAGKTTDLVQSAANLLILLIPLIGAGVIRQNVYSPATVAKIK